MSEKNKQNFDKDKPVISLGYIQRITDDYDLTIDQARKQFGNKYKIVKDAVTNE